MNATSPIRKFRQQAKMTQQELADRIGRVFSYISRIESGEFEPRPADARKMAEAMKIAHWTLLYHDAPIAADGTSRVRRADAKR